MQTSVSDYKSLLTYAGFYKSVALCVRESNKNYFKCTLYDTYEEGDIAFHDKYRKTITNSALIPISKLYPKFIQPYILQYELSKRFCRVHIED